MYLNNLIFHLTLIPTTDLCIPMHQSYTDAQKNNDYAFYG